jgi:hypothetical protein
MPKQQQQQDSWVHPQSDKKYHCPATRSIEKHAVIAKDNLENPTTICPLV